MKIYRLYHCDDYAWYEATDAAIKALDYWGTTPRDAKWRTPIVKKMTRQPAADFLSVAAVYVPIVSGRAKAVLEPHIGPYSEFLDVATSKGDKYYAINFPEVSDYFDYEADPAISKPTIYNNKLVGFDKPQFLTHKIDKIAFRSPDNSGFFYTDRFVEICAANKLTGLSWDIMFADK